jgi:hypothetical protein
MKTLILKGAQLSIFQGVELWRVCTSLGVNVFVTTPHSNIWNTIVKLFLKHFVLPVKIALNRNYPR